MQGHEIGDLPARARLAAASPADRQELLAVVQRDIARRRNNIATALIEAGYSVICMAGGWSVDLIVGHSGKTLLMAVDTDALAKMPHAGWRGGPLSFVTDVEGALRAAKMLRDQG